jgi:hypothetical protein
MNDVSRLEVASGGNHCITNRTTADTPTFLVNLGAAFGMNGAIGAIALIESPMRRCDDGVGILICNVPGDQPQRYLSDFCFHENDRIAHPALCPPEFGRAETDRSRYAVTRTALFFFRYFSTVDMPLQELELLTASGLASL